LVEVARNDSVTGKERDEEELKKLANDFLTLALGLNVQELKKISAAGTHHDGSVFLVE
jgi:hypothetical protein